MSCRNVEIQPFVFQLAAAITVDSSHCKTGTVSISGPIKMKYEAYMYHCKSEGLG